MHQSPVHALEGMLQHRNPARVLVVSHSPCAFVDDPAGGRQVQRLCGVLRYPGASGLGRYDLALVADQLEHMARTDALRLLAQLRDRHSPALAVIADLGDLRGRDAAWSLADFISLGLEPVPGQAGAAGKASLFAYDLASYNPPRDWNNPRFWAHPENFHKYRW